MSHTQTVIAVYVTHDEKEYIREWSRSKGKSMSGYFLDLFWRDYIKTSKKPKRRDEKTDNEP